MRRLAGVATAVAAAAGAVLFAVAAPSRASVQAIYVGGAGCSDSNGGTQASPLCTIGMGVSLAAATPGTSVKVNPGTYSEQVTIPASGTAAQPFTVTAVTPGTVTVSGGVHGFVVTGHSYVTIDGFNVTGTSGEGFDLSASSNLTISRNTVSGSGAQIQGRNASGFLLDGVMASVLTGDHADHNSLHGFELTGTTSGVTLSQGEASFNAEGWRRGASGVDVRAAGNTIVGTVLHDNEDAGLRFAPGGDAGTAADNVVYDNGDAGIDAVNTSNGAITGNTAFHNCTSGISVQGQSAKFTIENNIAVDNGVYAAYNNVSCSRRGGNIGVFDAATTGTKLDYNEVFLTSATGSQYQWGGTSYATLSAFQAAVAGQGAHDLQTDPKFTSATVNPADAATWNLRLTEGSSAIDSADSGAPGEQTVDADGDQRVDDGLVPNTGVGPRAFDDRGAYEFQASTAVPGPSASVAVTPVSGTVPLQVSADASASKAGSAAIVSYAFDFGDGSAKVGPQSGATATHTYTGGGTFTVTVTVSDAAGLTSTATSQVTATLVGPTAAASVTPRMGATPLYVTADASESTAGSAAITGYAFDFGDGSTPVSGTVPTATHTYTTVGTFTVTTTVTDANGAKATVIHHVVVSAGPAVANGDFESGSLAGWSASYNSGVTTTNPHGGTYAGQINAPAGGNGSIEQVVTGLTPNTSYTLTGWVRTDGGATILGTKQYNAADDDTGATTTATGWTQLSNQFTTGATNTSVDIYCYRSTAGTSACDDFSLALTPATLANPDFEAGSLAGWSASYNSGVTTTNPHGGTYAGQINAPAGGNGSIEQVVTGLTPNTSYTLTGWVRTDGGATILGAKQYNTTTNSADATTTATGWTQLTDQFTTGATGTSVDIYCYRNTAGTSACDDITLTLTPVPGTVANPGFEAGTLAGWNASYNAGITTTNPHSGTYAGQINAPTGGNGSIEQVVTGLTPNTAYTLTGWVRTDGGATILGAKQYDTTTNSADATTTATGWTQLTDQFTTGATNTSVDIYCYRPTAGTSACDDITLTKG
jgi:parallel beta-helix repeat protein